MKYLKKNCENKHSRQCTRYNFAYIRAQLNLKLKLGVMLFPEKNKGKPSTLICDITFIILKFEQTYICIIYII